MKLFDHKNPRHIEILREELSRAKKILVETDRQQFIMANSSMRGIFSIIYRDNEFKNTNEMQDYVAGVVNSKSTDKDDILTALRQYAKDNPEKMMEFNIEIQKMSEPIHSNNASGTSSLDADTYKAWQGRGGWQGD